MQVIWPTIVPSPGSDICHRMDDVRKYGHRAAAEACRREGVTTITRA
jgi:hypothetical protein